MRILTLSSAKQQQVRDALRRPSQNLATFRRRVRPIIRAVRSEGDRALFRFTEQFDRVKLTNLRVPSKALKQAVARIPRNLLQAIKKAQRNIQRFHSEETGVVNRIETQPGVRCWRETRPLERVGLYIPGGTAPLFSTVLMLAIPASIAGVERIALATPPRSDGSVADEILAACAMTGIGEVYAVGGAQAIAALAYGTQTIAKVDKIAGPGNAYVTAAKAEVSIDPQGCAIDMLAGPSELMIIADASADPRFVAADLLSQAEHDAFSQVMLVTTSEELLQSVQLEIRRQVARLPRRDIARKALRTSVGILVQTMEEAIDLANRYAPEHLNLQIERAQSWVKKIRNAGSVFLGPFAPETVGDYCSGTNHVLPTLGTARVQSGISVRTFERTMTVQSLSQTGLQNLRKTATIMARAEGLEGHARAVDIRFSPE